MGSILSFGDLTRLLRTVRHLRPVQIYGRVRFRLARPRVDLAPAPDLRDQAGRWQLPARRSPSLLSPTLMRFLNEDGDVLDLGWDDPSKSKLWRYNQHYFDDLNAVDATGRHNWHADLIDRWIAENPPPHGSGWEPYPASLRIVNWIKFALGGHDLAAPALHSLAVQARWLSKRLEWHLLGNHLFVNAKALVFAGLFFKGDEADGWLEAGLEILRQQMPEQILDDGAQFELSPMYHALALEDVLDLINAARVFGRDEVAREFEAHVPKMLDWLRAMSHPDGCVAFFNDTAIGIAPSNEELLRYALDLRFDCEETAETQAKDLRHCKPSGYVRMALGPAVVIADLAHIGPDYLPGHAHADTLSFEMSLGGSRFVVNSGTSVYGTGPERLRQRGTAAHSTLLVDGENSSEVWSGFRVGRRAMPSGVSVFEDQAELVASAGHDGFAHLAGGPRHHREWRLGEEGLRVTDTVSGAGMHRLEAYFHLAPGIEALATGASSIRLEDENSGLSAAFTCYGGAVGLIDSSWHPEFGKTIATKAIRVFAERALPHAIQYEFRWTSQ